MAVPHVAAGASLIRCRAGVPTSKKEREEDPAMIPQVHLVVDRYASHLLLLVSLL
jgi:hypothetical protein